MGTFFFVVLWFLCCVLLCVFSRAPECIYTHPPVLVYGTGGLGNSWMLFSASCPVMRFARRLSSAFDCLVTFLLASIPTLTQAGAGILICCASTTPYGLALAPD